MLRPPELGLPAKFASWRPSQEQAIKDSLSCSTRFLVQNAPTGLGKTLMYIAAMMQRCEKTIILTSTKGLQDQLIKDFGQIGLVEVRGKKNYRCVMDGGNCEDGACNYGVDCVYKSGGCPYYDALRQARMSRYVVTNYAMWLSMGEFLADGVKLLVLDEAHAAPDHLHDHLAVEIDLGFFGEVLDCPITDPFPLSLKDDAWGWWYRKMADEVQILIKQGLFNPDMNLKKLRQLARCARILENLGRIINSVIVVEKTGKGKYEVNPLILTHYGESCLFRGVPTVRLTSATVTDHTARMLGAGERTVMEYPSPFPLENRPVYWLPTVKVDRKMDHGARLIWLARIDQIVKSRGNTKGIIHTVSYDRAKDIALSNCYTQAVLHHSFDAAEKVRRFKLVKFPAILISPSMTTGWDFPYDECRWQIIAKVPFPDSRSLIHQERAKRDPQLPFYMAWQTLIQAAGRGVRAEDDRCETFIIDDHFEWLWHRYGHLAPSWFKAAIKKVSSIP